MPAAARWPRPWGRKYLAPYCDCYSAGTEVKDRINPDAVRLMKQVHGIDMEKDQYPKLLSALPRWTW